MERQEQIDFGERLLVAGVAIVLVTEAIFTVLSITSHPFTWTRLLLSVAGGVLILILGAWLYTGDRRAWLVALGWVSLELVLTLIPLGLLLLTPADTEPSLAPRPRTEEVVLALGFPLAWVMLIKLLAYLTFLLLLLLSVTVRAFLSSRPAAPPEPVPTNAPAGSHVVLTPQQTALFQSLAGTFQGVGLLAVAAGAGLLVYETATAPAQTGPVGLTLLEGLVLLILGLVLLLPPGALNVASQSETEPADLDQVFRRLGWLSVGVLVGSLVFLGVALAQLKPLLPV